MLRREQEERIAHLPLWRVLAMSVTPFALPRPAPLHSAMSTEDRRDAQRSNQRFLQRHMDVYIRRSARALLAGFAAQAIGFVLLIPIVPALGSILMLTAMVHMAVLILWKQHLDNRLGPRHPPE